MQKSHGYIFIYIVIRHTALNGHSIYIQLCNNYVASYNVHASF